MLCRNIPHDSSGILPEILQYNAFRKSGMDCFRNACMIFYRNLSRHPFKDSTRSVPFQPFNNSDAFMQLIIRDIKLERSPSAYFVILDYLQTNLYIKVTVLCIYSKTFTIILFDDFSRAQNQRNSPYTQRLTAGDCDQSIRKNNSSDMYTEKNI